MKSLFVSIVAVLALAGCASTHSSPKLTANTCQTSDWQAIGVADGKIGKYAYQFAQYEKRCQNANAHKPLWESGRQLGLKHYCTKANAYELGRRGFELHNVCPDDENLGEIHRSHTLGYQQYYMQERLNRQLGFGFYDYPFGYPFWW